MSDIYPNGTMHAEGSLTGSMEQVGNLEGSLSGNGNLIGSIDKIMKVPTKTSDLINDSGFITEDDIPPIPEKTSDLTNDSGFITEDDIPLIPEKTSDLTNDSGFITSNDIPPIPEKTSDLINDSGFITSNDIPPIPEKTSDLTNDSGFITEDDIPPLVTNLGEIDPEEYDYDVFTFINTLIDNGWYFFLFYEFTYFVQVQSFGDDNNAYVNQHVWYNEENPSIEYIRGLHVEDGEVVEEISGSYITYETASSAFASKTHYHYRTANSNASVWDYCNTSIMINGSPILYTDMLNHKQYLIETWQPARQPIYYFQRLTDLEDGGSMYQRKGIYSAGVTTWDDWYKFSGTVFTP